MTNGQFTPTISIDAQKWYRFRVAFSAINDYEQGFPLQLWPPACQMQLLAKDGIYLPDACGAARIISVLSSAPAPRLVRERAQALRAGRGRSTRSTLPSAREQTSQCIVRAWRTKCSFHPYLMRTRILWSPNSKWVPRRAPLGPISFPRARRRPEAARLQ